MRTRYVGFHFVILLLIQLEFLKLTELKSVLDKRDTMVEISYPQLRQMSHFRKDSEVDIPNV